MAAVFYARAVLISYIAFMLTFAMLAMAIFKNTVNVDAHADSFSNIGYAFVTGFVFISTTENYAIVYDVFDSDFYVDAHWTVCSSLHYLSIQWQKCLNNTDSRAGGDDYTLLLHHRNVLLDPDDYRCPRGCI